mmetsp:Transcript_10026/g.28747  ORF Transcript_10026/g.28747 Transcript_10026/m.28747 type:complete len:108 (+) Transcript_10026:1-324(+)
MHLRCRLASAVQAGAARGPGNESVWRVRKERERRQQELVDSFSSRSVRVHCLIISAGNRQLAGPPCRAFKSPLRSDAVRFPRSPAGAGSRITSSLPEYDDWFRGATL